MMQAAVMRVYREILHLVCVFIGVTHGNESAHVVALCTSVILNAACIGVSIAQAHELAGCMQQQLFAVGIGASCLLSLILCMFDLGRLPALRKAATSNRVHHVFKLQRYLQVPVQLTGAVLLLAMPLGARLIMVAFLFLQMVQAAVWLADLSMEMRTPMRYASTQDRKLLQQPYIMSIGLHFTCYCFLNDVFVRRALLPQGADTHDIVLFCTTTVLWIVFLFTQHRLHALSNLLEVVWPGASACLSEESDLSMEEESQDASTIVIHSGDQRVYTINLNETFDAYAYLHKPQPHEKEGEDIMRVARIGAGPRIFDKTFSDNEAATRAVIGRVTRWRLTGMVNLCGCAVHASALWLLTRTTQ